MDFIWGSDFVVFLLPARIAGSRSRCASEAQAIRLKGAGRAERVGAGVKFGGRRSHEGQGYGQVGVAARSKYAAPLRGRV